MRTRRTALKSLACGFGYLALADMLSAGTRPLTGLGSPGNGAPHHAPKAKRVIFIFMQGGPSQVDTFDYKPRLTRDDGRMMSFQDARTFARDRTVIEHRVMKNLWRYRQYGQSGKWVSDLFPHIAQHADDICFLQGMHTEGIAHGPATLFMHTGSINLVRPSVGAWTLYGLGTENNNLPGFITICPSMGNGGSRNWSNAFLPSTFQGTPIGRAGIPASEARIRNLTNPQRSPDEQRAQLDLLRALNEEQARRHSPLAPGGRGVGGEGDSELDAVIQSYDLAFRMQMNAPEILDLSRETAETHRLYGIGQAGTDNFGRQCLMARRLTEAGVRYVQINYGDNTDNPAWDQHSNLPMHATHARNTDQPVAGLLADLKRRGLLEDTLVWWGGEFGRTPYAERNGTGRDHNPGGFTQFLCGAGIKPGIVHGETDEFGNAAVNGKVHMHDMHATILHLLGLDHLRLTHRYDGRNFRLTDV
ncbi:MAG: DUF1501 domain-containing protein, partial [Planctomycetes bacterium]|nr:DUF1501 domain-containing protein [Planctomycetota bacterium]